MTGANGVNGTVGTTGAKGDKGDTGLTGAKGDKGDTGAQGIKGDTGLQGVPGVKGDQGIQGQTGVTGSTGPQGLQGLTGATGATGQQGIQGAKGDTGVSGTTVLQYARRTLTTNSSGVWSGTLPTTGLALSITPRTAGAMLASIVESGTTITITFQKLNTGALGLTVGNLLTASILSSTVGVVTFDLLAMTVV